MGVVKVWLKVQCLQNFPQRVSHMPQFVVVELVIVRHFDPDNLRVHLSLGSLVQVCLLGLNDLSVVYHDFI